MKGQVSVDYQIAGFAISRVLLTLRDRQRNASLECSFYETAATQFELECLQNNSQWNSIPTAINVDFYSVYFISHNCCI